MLSPQACSDTATTAFSSNRLKNFPLHWQNCDTAQSDVKANEFHGPKAEMCRNRGQHFSYQRTNCVLAGAKCVAQGTKIWHDMQRPNSVAHYGDIIIGAMASQITPIVYLIVYSGADQRKHQSSALLAFVWGFHRWTVNSHHKGPVTPKMFPFDDAIMTWDQNMYRGPKFVPSQVNRTVNALDTLHKKHDRKSYIWSFRANALCRRQSIWICHDPEHAHLQNSTSFICTNVCKQLPTYFAQCIIFCFMTQNKNTQGVFSKHSFTHHSFCGLQSFIPGLITVMVYTYGAVKPKCQKHHEEYECPECGPG